MPTSKKSSAVQFDVKNGEFQSVPYEIVEKLDVLIEQLRAGNDCVSALQALVTKYPNFIDAHAHYATALFHSGNILGALGAARIGYNIGVAAIPADFTGHIEWAYLENRPFLRAAHIHDLCLENAGQFAAAADVYRKMLSWNPNDNQGVRYLIGGALLASGDTKGAIKAILAIDDTNPSTAYDLALAYFQQRNFIKAATAARRGFAGSPYIAEMLTTNSDPLLLKVWQLAPYDEIELAASYYKVRSDQWAQVHNALSFLHWLFNHSSILAERSRCLAPYEALAWEHEGSKRMSLIDASR